MKAKKNNRHQSVIFMMAGILGFEPRFTVLETVALPLNYTPMCGRLLATLFILASSRDDVNNFL